MRRMANLRDKASRGRLDGLRRSDEQLGLKENPSKTSNHTPRRRSWRVSNQNIAPKVSKWQFILQRGSTTRATAFDSRAAAKNISRKVSFCQYPSNCTTLLYGRSYDQISPPERVGNETILTALSAPFSKLCSESCASRSLNRDVADSTRIGSESI
jgi:hypothetical protein